MIGHTFSTNGARVLTLAPGWDAGTYIVLAQTTRPGIFAVARLAQRDIIEATLALGTGKAEEGGPHQWLSADHFDYEGAIHAFVEATGVDITSVEDNLDQAARAFVEFSDAPRSTRVVSIQQSTLPDLRRPYPYVVVGEGEHAGYVLWQDFWRGEPYFLVGFQNRVDVQQIDLHMPEFLAAPGKAAGKYPVFSDATTGGFYVEQVVVSHVNVFDVAGADLDELTHLSTPADDGTTS